jgi:hypothetical protein
VAVAQYGLSTPDSLSALRVASQDSRSCGGSSMPAADRRVLL